MKLSQASLKKAAFWICLALADALALALLVLPAVNRSAVLAEAITADQAAISQKSNHDAQLAGFLRQVEAKQASLDKIGGSWTSGGASLPSLMYFLRQTAAASGLQVNTVDFSGLPNLSARGSGNQSSPVTVKMDVSGSYEALKTFLEKIEGSIPLMEVTDLSFTSGASGAGGAAAAGQGADRFTLTITTS